MGRAGTEPEGDRSSYGDGKSARLSEGACLCDPCRCGRCVAECGVPQADPEHEGEGGTHQDGRADPAGDRERAPAVREKEALENVDENNRLYCCAAAGRISLLYV